MPPRSRLPRSAIRIIHRHQWLWEPLENEPTFLLRSMFGTKAAYLDGRLMLVFGDRAEPWRGVLVCTEHRHHAALRAKWPELQPHPVLPKWLYLPEAAPAFERIATALVAHVRQRDPHLGILPAGKKKRAGKKRGRARGRP